MSQPLDASLTDPDLLAGKLADSNEVHSETAGSTLADLRRELDTLADQLRTQLPADPYEDESACRRVIEAIGRDPTGHELRERPDFKDEPTAEIPPELATLGQYRLLAKLGQGGMGAVYKALHVRLDKVVAIKVLPQEVTRRPDAVARFEREMRAVGKLHHPNIVAAHDAGEANGNHFLVMELVDGEDVGSLVRRRGPLPIAESCEIIRQAALGLQHAHEHGLVHRDIKPSNLMVSALGERRGVSPPVTTVTRGLTPPGSPTVKILDMGLALLDESHREAAGELTSTGQIMGTLDYMAPEQGADTHAVDIRADVYSLGATLYKLLTGRAPFESDRYRTAMKKLTALATAEPDRVDKLRPDVPRPLADLVHRMLSKSPEQRPTPPADVARLIAPFAAGADLARLLLVSSDSPAEVFPTAETATDPTFIAETNVSQQAPREGAAPAEPTEAASPLSRANRSNSQTAALMGEGPWVRANTAPPSAPSSILHPQYSVAGSPPRRRSLLKYAKFAVPLFIGLAVIVINNKEGTVTVETPDQLTDQVKIVLKENGTVVETLDANNRWKVTVRAGEYEVEVLRGDPGLKIDIQGEKLGVSRWGTTLVEMVVTEVAEAATPDSDEPTTDFALQFDRPDAYADASIRDLDVTRPWTIECRVAAEPGASGEIAATIRGIRLWLDQGTLHARIPTIGGGSTELEAHVQGGLPRQFHVALVDDGRGARIFVDGEPRPASISSEVPSGDATDASQQMLRIGGPSPLNDPQPDTVSPRTIDELRVSSVARYRESIPPDERHKPDEHTLVLYHLDEGQGQVLTDASEHGNHGTIVGAKWVPANGNYDADRRAAEWVLSMGSAIRVWSHDQDLFVNSAADLPQDSFQLTLVNLRYNQAVTDDGLARLNDCHNLTFLNLNGTRVSDAGLAYFQDCRNLTFLLLNDTQVTDAGLEPFAGCSKLSAVDVRKTKVTEAGVQKLAAALPQCRIDWDGGVIDPRPSPGISATPTFVLQFDGDNDVVRLPGAAFPAAAPVTYEARVTLAEVKPANLLVTPFGGLKTDNLGRWMMLIWDRGNKVVSLALNYREPTVAGHEYHVAAAWDGATYRLFVDGRMVAEKPLAATPEAAVGEPVCIGGYYNSGTNMAAEVLNGTVREVRISDVVRYTEEFIPAGRFETDEHTLALYHFDEGAGVVLRDASGNGQDGQIVGATWVRTDLLDPRPAGSGPYDPAVDRSVAEALLRAGGNVAIVAPPAPADVGQLQSYPYGTNLFHQLPLIGQEQMVRTLEELPVEPFHITRIQFRQQAAIDSSLVESLADLPFLFELNLEHSAVTDSHAAVIGRLSQLRYLNVGATNLTDEGLRELSGLANLRYLAVWNTPGITDAGLEHVSRLTNLVEIYLHGNPQITDRGIAFLRDLPHVGWLWLEGTGITDAALESVSGFQELDSLRVSGTKINGSGLTHLSRLQKLNWLFLHDTEITDEFGVLLKDVQFGSLWLSGTSVGDATLAAISGRPDIHQLILNGTGITDAGLAHLKGTRIVHLSANNTALMGSGLADLNIVQVLDVSHTQLTDKAARSLSRLATLTILNVAETLLSEETVRSLRESLPNCTIYSDFGTFEPANDRAVAEWALSVGGNVVIQLADARQPRLFPGDNLPEEPFSVLGVALARTAVVDRDLERLIGLRSLHGVHLRETSITDEGLRYLAQIETLRQLGAGYTKITDEGVRLLNQPLTELWLEGTAVTDASLEHTERFALRHLGLSDTAITDVGLSHIGKLRNLESLGLVNCRHVSDAGLGALADLSQLTSLALDYTPATDAALEPLGRLTLLQQLSLEGTAVTDAGLQHLAGLKSLTTLRIVSAGVSDAGLAVLANMPDLTVLDLRGTGVNDARIAWIASTFKLEEFYLSSTAITDAALAELAAIGTLRLLTVDQTTVTEDAVEKLRTSLPHCRIVSDFGTFEPRPAVTPATTDSALQFDGKDDYVEIPLAGVQVGPEFTVELQVQTTTVPTIAQGPAEVTWLLDWPRDEAFSLEWWASTDQQSALSASVNKTGAFSYSKWQEPAPGSHHFAIVYRDGATQLFVDGRAEDYNGQSQVAPSGLSSHVLAIGARLPVEHMQNGQFHYFQGQVDELRISTVARYTEDFMPAARHEPDEHTLALYHFDEGEGDVLRDASGNGHDGRIIGASWVPAFAAAVDRATAEWVLSVGGKVTVQMPGEEQPRQVADLSEIPVGPWSLIGVDLGYTQVTDDDLARLRGATALQTLNLDSAELIGDAGLAHLAGLPLTSLDLRSTQVTDASVPVLQQLPQLSLLSLAHTGVTDAGMSGLARLSQLEHLILCNNPISDAGLADLRGLSSLKSLTIYDTAITDAGLAHVAEMTALEYLHVGDTQVSDTGLIHLSSLKQLRQLNLDRTGISDAGLVHLAALPSITALWLEGTQLTDAGLQHLQPLSTLGDLSVKGTGVTELGLQQLHADLPGCRIVSDFGTVEPANDRTIAEWVLSRQGLVGLRDGDADVEVREVSELPAACRVLKVTLGDVSDSDLINLKGLEGLQELMLRNCPQLTDAGLVHLRELPNLRWLILGGTTPDLTSQVSDRGMAVFLEGFPLLQFVSLQYEAITDEGLRHLCSKPGLGMLDLYGTSISDEGLQHLPKLAGLSIVTLPVQIGDAGLAHLKGMKSLTTVYLPGCDRVTAEGLRTLASLPGLFELQLTNTQLNDEDLLVLAGSTTLRKLHLRGTNVTQDGIDRLRQALPGCWIDTDFGAFEPQAAMDRAVAEWVLAVGGKVTVKLAGEEQPRLIATADTLPGEEWQLVGVDLGYTKVTNEDLARLRGAVTLKTLVLDTAEPVGDAGLAHLAGLPLTSLDLRSTQVTDRSVPVLQQLPQLSLLSLAHTGVTDAGMAGLAKLSQLEHLNICNNPISDAGLAELRGMTSLKSLGIYDTAITDAGLAHVAEMMALEYLHVGDTQVSDAGLIHLASLKQLRQLNLDRTGISDAGLVHLAALPSIAALWLEGTQITEAGLQHLKPLTTLGDLFVTSTAVTEAGLQQLHADLPGCRIVSDFGTVEPAEAAPDASDNKQ